MDATLPKATSAPATPCNVTPTTISRNIGTDSDDKSGPSPANTLPTDISKRFSATCRVLTSSVGGHEQATSWQYLERSIKRGEALLESEDFEGAVRSFDKCIDMAATNQEELKKDNTNVYGLRAEAHLKLGNYNEALADAIKARELNPKWPHCYYLQGQAAFLLNQWHRALAAFSYGISLDLTNQPMFDALVNTAMNSPLKNDFEPKYEKLKARNLHEKPFWVVSILGQEMLATDHEEEAAVMLELALKMGVDADKRQRGSVLSTLSYAFCRLGKYERAINYMNMELEIETQMEDYNGQCRVLSNLGYTYYKERNFEKSLEAHRKQLNLSIRTHLFPEASAALNAIGHIHVERGDYQDALTSHTRCLEILKQLGDNEYRQFKELLSIGHIQSMMGQLKESEVIYKEAYQMLQASNGKVTPEDYHIGHIMMSFSMAYLSLKKQSFAEAKQHYMSVLKLAKYISNPKRSSFEERARNGMDQLPRLCTSTNFGSALLSSLELAVPGPSV